MHESIGIHCSNPWLGYEIILDLYLGDERCMNPLGFDDPTLGWVTKSIWDVNGASQNI